MTTPNAQKSHLPNWESCTWELGVGNWEFRKLTSGSE